MTYTKTSPYFAFFRPFRRFFALERQNYPPPAGKNRHRGAQAARIAPAAPSRPSALRPVACPVARPLGLAPLWARGRGVCGAPFGSPRPAAVPPFCAPCSSLPSASATLLARLNGALCADGRGVGGQQSRSSAARACAVAARLAAVSPSAGVVAPSLVRVVGGQLLPRPLAASPSSVWSAWPLAALSRASA